MRQGGAYYQVHRADLIGVLEAGARAAGVEIELGAEVADVADGPEPVVTLAGGGERRADLVIGADGVHSRLRGGSQRDRGAVLYRACRVAGGDFRMTLGWGRSAACIWGRGGMW